MKGIPRIAWWGKSQDFRTRPGVNAVRCIPGSEALIRTRPLSDIPDSIAPQSYKE